MRYGYSTTMWFTFISVSLYATIKTTKAATTLPSQGCAPFEIHEGDSGTIQSPSINGSYPADTNCSWLLRGPVNTLLNITFVYFDIEEDFDNCKYDYLTIRDGNSQQARKVFDEDLCGQNRSMVGFESSSNEVLVTFISDESEQRAGFKLIWTAVADCLTDEFRCWSGSCIDKKDKCNLQKDCDDESDEMECEHPDNICGRQSIAPEFNWPARIVGGSFAARGSWPWQAYLSRRVGDIFCGASILNNDWVLTAAHCNVYSEIYVVVGAYDIEDNATRILVSSAYDHEEYVARNLTNGYDISLLRLSKSIVFSTTIQPICLTTGASSELRDGEMCVVTGWGKLRENAAHSSKLRQVRVPVISQDQCKKANRAPYPRDRLFCGGYYLTGGADACQGDSGGPLVCYRTNSWVQFGVVSYGNGCAEPGSPGYYTKVTAFFDWIQNVTVTAASTLPVITESTFPGTTMQTSEAIETTSIPTESTFTDSENITNFSSIPALTSSSTEGNEITDNLTLQLTTSSGKGNVFHPLSSAILLIVYLLSNIFYF